MGVTPTITAILSNTDAAPNLVIPSEHIGKTILIQMTQTNGAVLEPYTITSSNGTYDLIATDFLLNTEGGAGPLTNTTVNCSIFSKVADGNDDTILNTVGAGGSIHVACVVYVIEDAYSTSLAYNTLKDPDMTFPIAPSRPTYGRDRVNFTMVCGFTGDNNNFVPPSGYTLNTAFLNSSAISASAETGLVNGVAQDSWTINQARYITFTFDINLVPTKITIGVINDTYLHITGDITKDNLIIKN